MFSYIQYTKKIADIKTTSACTIKKTSEEIFARVGILSEAEI